MDIFQHTRSHLKNRILAQGQGGAEDQPAGILQYSEELKRGPNTEIGPKDFFEMASRDRRKKLNDLVRFSTSSMIFTGQRPEIWLLRRLLP